MKRVQGFILGVLLVLALPVVGKHHNKYPCDYHPSKGLWHRKRLIACEDNRIGAPGTPNYIIGVAECESGADLQDKYDGDSHAGPFQQLVSRWPDRYSFWRKPADEALRNDVTDFRANTVISLRMARADGTWARQWACA